MKKMVAAFALLLSACGGSASTQESTSNTASQSPEITRADFVQLMVQIMPSAICENEQHPLRACIERTAEECSTQIAALAQSCAAQAGSNIPDMIPDTEEAGERYGAIIGECVGNGYVTQARTDGKFKANDPNCQPAQ